MRGNKLVVRPADLLIKFDVRSATQVALSRDCGMKNSADEQRVIANMRAKQKRLLRSGAVQRDQDIGNVLFGQMMCPACNAVRSIAGRLVGNLESARVRKCFQQRCNIITKLSVPDSALLQHVASEHVKVKLR